MELYFLRAKTSSGGVKGSPVLTDKENLKKAIKELKWQEEVERVYVNRAVIAICGWFCNGDYLGEY